MFSTVSKMLTMLMEIDSEMVSVVDFSNTKTIMKSYSAHWGLQFFEYNICFLCCIEFGYV
jgi:hypothetical protein